MIDCTITDLTDQLENIDNGLAGLPSQGISLFDEKAAERGRM
jgi:hypothetical protein